MSSEQEKDPINVVAVDSSDDEDGVGAGKRVNVPSNVVSLRSRMGAQNTITNPPSVSGNPAPESRSFWKAGSYDIGPTRWDPSQGQLEHARVHPKFLHSNATSHKWAFGAIAELLDNSVDEICNGATFVKVNRIHNLKDNSPALLFQDDGGGMDPDGIRKCMSLGYSSKKANTTIGQYGNGFKTSTMRLGADVIVFSRASRSGRATQSVGLLSYTFLRRTGQDDVIVPMVDFDISDHWAEPIIFSSQDDWSANLKIILEWSPFASKDELMLQFEDIGSHGTKIIVYNLWLNDEGIFELNFDDDGEDVSLRDETNRASLSRVPKKVLELQSHISYRIRFSLRAYVSILYLKKFTNFQIILRGKPVEQFNIADELKHPKVITYRPQFTMTSKEASVETTIGFIKEAPALGVCGFNVYHKNRLIRPFWKVTGDGSSRGHGVVGVLEANFIEPAHDKQDFERSSLFLRLEMKLKQMIMDYWKDHCQLIGLVPPGVRMRNTQDSPVRPPVGLVANIKNQIHADRHIIGLAASAQKELHLDQPIIGLAANPKRDPSDAQPGIHGDESLSVQPIIGIASGSVQEMTPVDSSRSTSIDQIGVDNIQLLESVQQMTPVDSSRSASIDQICEENIQLFMRCEEHVQKENELKHTIEELEKQLEETKRKCAQLSLHLENQRKLKMMKQTQKG